MSKFAREQMMKYGWTEGKGLGKNETGIAEAIRPKLKFDKAGIGHKDEDIQWWQNAYDKAINSVIINKNVDAVSINVEKPSETENQQQEKQQFQYGKFLKTSILQNGLLSESNEKKTDLPLNNSDFTNISDEDLFKACGGRTAHKGARHGLKLNGKLARIAEQDKILTSDSSQITEVKKKRKRDSENLLLSSDSESDTDEDHNIDVIISNISKQYAEGDYKISKKGRRKTKRKVDDLGYHLTKTCSIESSMDELKDLNEKKPSKIKRKLEDELFADFIKDNKSQKKSKKKKKNKDIETVTLLDDSDQVMEPEDSNNKEVSNDFKIVKHKKKCLQNSGGECTCISKIQKYTFCTNIDAEKLNTKIMKKKSRKYLKKQKEKEDNLCMEMDSSLSIDTKESSSMLSSKLSKTLKHKKKSKKNKKK